MAYPKVNIVNSTTYKVKGTVSYVACKHQDYDLQGIPGDSWTAPKRGVCLLKEITATVTVDHKDIVATPYIVSFATSYSKFAVIHCEGFNNFMVTRRVGGVEDTPTTEDAEPEETQK